MSKKIVEPKLTESQKRVVKKTDAIREQYGFTQDEIKILHFVNPVHQTQPRSSAIGKAQHIAGLNNRLQSAIRNRKIIDEDQDVMLLEYPLNDERTSLEIRKAYLIQSQIRHYWLWDAKEDIDEEPDGEQVTDLIYPENICPKCYRFVEVDPCPYCGATGIVLGPKVKKTVIPKKVGREVQPDEKVVNPWL